MGGIEVPVSGAVGDGVEYLWVEGDVGAGKNTGEKLWRHSVYSASEAVSVPSGFRRRLEEGGVW